MHANQAQFPIESIPAPRCPERRRTTLRAVQSPQPESDAEPGTADATRESPQSNVLITLAHELAAAAGLMLWLGACIVAATMMV